jgi:hypothetical protein
MAPDSGPAGTALFDLTDNGVAPARTEHSPRAGRQRVLSLRSGDGPSSSSLRLATLVHLASLAGAFAFWAWLDRGLWFFGDEWDFLLNRGLSYAPTSHHSIWFPHNEHWSTLPVLLWRGLFTVFHLSSYWPYLVPTLLAQVGIMHLAWRLCRRAGADPWVATGSVLVLGLLGAGAEDLSWAFQIGFTGSVLFGLVAVYLVDTPRPTRALPARLRGTATSAALLASLMCSTVGDAMVVGAAVLALARLPRRRALAVFAPPVTAYLIWFAIVGHMGLTEHPGHLTLGTFTSSPGYVWTGLSSALGQAFNMETAGATILVGLGTWSAWHMRRLWTEHPAVVSLSASALAFYVLAAIGRDASQASPTASRYVYIAIALLLPLIAKALSSLCTWSAARVGTLALLGFIALGNVGQAQVWTASRTALTSTTKDQFFATAALLGSGTTDVSGPAAAPVPLNPDLTVADMASLAHSGFIPSAPPPGPLSLFTTVDTRAVLALGTWDGSAMSLTHAPLSTGELRFTTVVFGLAGTSSNGCTTFLPQAVSPPMQIWMHMPATEQAASIEIESSPPPAGATDYLGAMLVLPREPSSSPVELTVPARGTGYLNDNDNGADLVILWTEDTPVTLCDFSRSA